MCTSCRLNSGGGWKNISYMDYMACKGDEELETCAL
jgi:hypothetical protein